MSLILDALKKLEREKQTTPRGFLVVAPGGWAGQSRGVTLVAGALFVGLVLGAVLLAAYGRLTQAAVPQVAGGVPTPAATPTTAAATAPTSGLPLPTPRPRAFRSAAPPTPPALVVGAPAAAPSTEPAPAASEKDGPQLQAISEQDGFPVAVIDERIMREGEEHDGLKVLRIGAAEVEIEHLGKRRILRF